MIVVVNLITKVFISLFFFMILIEIIVFTSLIICNITSVTSTIQQINDFSKKHQKGFSNSFISFIETHHANIQSDLLLIAKHLLPISLAYYPNIRNTKYLKFAQNSSFFNTLNSTNPYLNYNELSKKPAEEEDMYLNKFNNDKLNTYASEDDIIESFLNDNSFNFLTAYTDDNLNSIENYRVYGNYAITILKTILIRNALYEKKHPIYLKFQLFLEDKYIIEYPPNKIEKNNFDKNLNYYNQKDIKCDSSNLIFCTSPKNKFKRKDQIFFDDIKYNKNAIPVSRACISIDFSDKESYACIEFSYYSIFINIVYQSTKTEFFIFKNDTVEPKKFFSYYYSKFNLNQTKEAMSVNNTIDLSKGILNNLGLYSNDSYYVSLNDDAYNGLTTYLSESYFSLPNPEVNKEILLIQHTRDNKYTQVAKYTESVLLSPIKVKNFTFDEETFVLKPDYSEGQILFYSLVLSEEAVTKKVFNKQ